MKYSDTLKAIQKKHFDAAKAFVETAKTAGRALTDDEQAKVDGELAAAKKLDAQIASAIEVEKAEAPQPKLVPSDDSLPTDSRLPKTPACAKRHSNLRAFKSAERAYAFGVYVAATLTRSRWALERAKNLFDINAIQTEGVNTDGGFLVPEEFSAEMVDLREKYGVFRRECRVVPMSRDTLTLGRRTAGLTPYATAEGVAGTVSTKTWDRIGLTARKWTILALVTKELAEDAIIAVADNLMSEMAYAFAKKEDEAGFNGDGTSDYNGITGLKNALGASCKVTQGSSNTWSAQVLADFNNLMAKIPDFTQNLNLAFYCNKAYYHSVMERLAMATGGTSSIEIVNGIPKGRFFGYPVNFVAAMPRVTATTGICCYFGDLGAAAKFGDRRQTTFSQSDQAYVGSTSVFETDEIAIKATERFDIVVHERGTSTSTDAAGPIAALITG